MPSFHSVFMIAATNSFLRFIHFRFGLHYLDYLDAADDEAQQELVDDARKDTFVYMHSSKWFNLQSVDGRRNALCHILALLRWHDTHSTLELSEGQEDTDDSMKEYIE